MVCKKCEAKLSAVIVPDKWKEGAKNTELGKGRAVNPNMLIQRRSRVVSAIPASSKCKICKQSILGKQGHHYCQACAYKKGICAMCGVKILDTSKYRQSSA